MGWPEIIDKLDENFKKILISLAFLMPFWYLNLYLFNQDFFIKNDLLLKIIACFCLSTGWYGLNYFLTFIHNFTNLTDHDSNYSLSGINSVIILISITSIEYYIQPYSPNNFINFYLFLKFNVISMLALIFLAFVINIFVIPSKIELNNFQKGMLIGMISGFTLIIT